jgi:hypothetical protein
VFHASILKKGISITDEEIQQNDWNEDHGKQEQHSRHNLVLTALGELCHQEMIRYMISTTLERRTVSIWKTPSTSMLNALNSDTPTSSKSSMPEKGIKERKLVGGKPGLPLHASPLGFFPMIIQKLCATATIAMARTSNNHLNPIG